MNNVISLIIKALVSGGVSGAILEAFMTVILKNNPQPELFWSVFCSIVPIIGGVGTAIFVLIKFHDS